MAIVAPQDVPYLLAMGYAEYIIPAMNQDVADHAIEEYLESGGAAAGGVRPGQPGTITPGEVAGEPGLFDILAEFRASDIHLPALPPLPTLVSAGKWIAVAAVVVIVGFVVLKLR